MQSSFLNKAQTNATSRLFEASFRFILPFKTTTWAMFSGSCQNVSENSDFPLGYMVGLHFLALFFGSF